MKTSARPLLVGDVVELERSWGSVSRLKCPGCTKFLPRRAGNLVCGCGIVYKPLDGQGYEVVSL